MAKMSTYMVVHNDPFIYWEEVEENWAKLAKVETCTWVRTLFNKKKGLCYGEWLAPEEDALRSVFQHLCITYESIVKVDETIPDKRAKKARALKDTA
ncbi:MAG: DUF4242 domain-containing protein [Desulfobacterales bacterium]|jgi:hypothetical protein